MDLGTVGIWSGGFSDDAPGSADAIRAAATELEELGFGAIWLGSNPAVRHAAQVLAATSRIAVATGILNIWQHDAADVAVRQLAVEAEHPGRFVLGLGAGHAGLAPGYAKPYSAMAGYLDRLDAAGSPPERRVLAALGPRMLGLARDRAAGAHPYLVTPEHTAVAREILGPGAFLAPEMKVVLDDDAERARAAARGHFAFYAKLPNYLNNLKRLGFTEDDLTGGGSDRLIDAVFAWGGIDVVRGRIAAHRKAGADHVAVQIVTAENHALPRRHWRALAEGLELGRTA